MTSKHFKTKRPSDKDLDQNPLIGGSRGVTMAHATPDDVEDSAGANTFEGDLENATNRQGGIDKSERPTNGVSRPRRTSAVATRGSAKAHADGKHVGVGSQQKGAGTGGMTELPDGLIGENMVLSNRDKAQHSEERGQDSKWVQTEQLQDRAANRESGGKEQD